MCVAWWVRDKPLQLCLISLDKGLLALNSSPITQHAMPLHVKSAWQPTGSDDLDQQLEVNQGMCHASVLFCLSGILT